MIHEVCGDLFGADVEVLVNPVNTVGVMGKGLALQFKHRYPDMFTAYQQAARRRELALGRMHVWRTGIECPRLIVNFPTKSHWRERSRLVDIESGLADLVRVTTAEGVRSVAVPALGCGLGGLDWSRVEPLMVAAFAGVPDVEVRIYLP